jgi:hypothetical protein
MARNLIASKLIDSVRNRAMIPDDTTVYDDNAILDILNEEIDVGLLNTLLTLHEDHLTTHKNVPLTASKRYIIPHRAIGNKLKDLVFTNGEDIYELSRVDLTELSDYSYDGQSSSGNNLFHIEGDEVVLINSHYSSYANLRMYFNLRPNKLVLESKCAQISSIDRSTGIIQFDSLPKEFLELTEFDFIQNKTPNKILSVDNVVVSVSVINRTVTVSPDTIPSRLSVGDWVCFPEESPYPNIPTEMHPLLAQRAAVYILEAMGDSESLNNARGKLKQMEMSIQKILDDRVEGAPRKIKNRFGTMGNNIGLYRQNRGRL